LNGGAGTPLEVRLKVGQARSSVTVRLSLLADLASLLTHKVDLDLLLRTACDRLATALDADRATIWLVDSERGDLVTRVALLPELPQLRQPLGRGIAGLVARDGQPLRVLDAANDARFDPSADRVTGYVTRDMLVAPIREPGQPVRGVVQLLNHRGDPFSSDDEAYLVALCSQLAKAIEQTTLRASERSERGVLLRGPFNHIVGRSPAMDEVYRRLRLSAETDASVLLTGETGTGKGLLARAIHDNSARSAAPFVIVDSTTLPAELVESELFGHERGAFTGADRRLPGKVEVAAGGTLFLDEIGELPAASQGKFLRFLQDGSFERLGGREPLRADVRLITATHRDLRGEVAAARFREDLWFRVKVVEIAVPPLRARGAEEIAILARHFLTKYAIRYRRSAPELAAGSLAALTAHRWPGNVRELEHWAESVVVLSPDGRLDDDLLPPSRGSLGSPEKTAAEPNHAVALPLGLSLDEVTRRYAERTLAAADGNKTLAAERLGVGRGTLARLLKARPRERP